MHHIIKKETQYISVLLTLLLLVGVVLYNLVKKYAIVSIVSITEMCTHMLEAYSLNWGEPLTIIPVILCSLGIIFGVIRFIASISRTKKYLSGFDSIVSEGLNKYPKLQEVSTRLNLEKKISVLDTESKVAFVGGYLKSKIWISEGIMNNLSEKELETILLHEKYHLDKKHTKVFTILETIKGVFFFLPVVSDFIHYFKELMELKADKYVIDAQGESKYLISAIKKIKNSKPKISNLALGFSAMKSETRIKNLNQNNNIEFKVKNLVYSSLIIIIGVFFAIKPVSAEQRYIFESGNCINGECGYNCTEDQILMSIQEQQNIQRTSYSEIPFLIR